jgi:hypothetical protein
MRQFRHLFENPNFIIELVSEIDRGLMVGHLYSQNRAFDIQPYVDRVRRDLPKMTSPRDDRKFINEDYDDFLDTVCDMIDIVIALSVTGCGGHIKLLKLISNEVKLRDHNTDNPLLSFYNIPLARTTAVFFPELCPDPTAFKAIMS